MLMQVLIPGSYESYAKKKRLKPTLPSTQGMEFVKASSMCILMRSYINAEPLLNMLMLGELHTLCSFGTNSFKALLVRFEKKTTTWLALLLLAFSIRFLRKIKQKTKS